jgi:hypothetical protein
VRGGQAGGALSEHVERAAGVQPVLAGEPRRHLPSALHELMDTRNAMTGTLLGAGPGG